MGDFQNYQAMLTRSLQDFRKVYFGPAIEAKVAGTYAGFRLSDTPGFVSEIIAAEPVSLTSRFPDLVNKIRAGYDLPDLTVDQTGSAPPPATRVLDNGIGPDGIPDYQQQPSAMIDFGLVKWLNSNIRYFSFLSLGLVLLIGGLFLLAYSTDTGKAVVHTAAKTGAEAVAA